MTMLSSAPRRVCRSSARSFLVGEGRPIQVDPVIAHDLTELRLAIVGHSVDEALRDQYEPRIPLALLVEDPSSADQLGDLGRDLLERGLGEAQGRGALSICHGTILRTRCGIEPGLTNPKRATDVRA